MISIMFRYGDEITNLLISSADLMLERCYKNEADYNSGSMKVIVETGLSR